VLPTIVVKYSLSMNLGSRFCVPVPSLFESIQLDVILVCNKTDYICMCVCVCVCVCVCMYVCIMCVCMYVGESNENLKY
jgi:hypothetical protein